MQDFYATLYLANMISAIKLETDQIITEKIRDKELVGSTYKLKYKTNENILIGSLKHVYIFAVLSGNVKIRKKWLCDLINKVSKYKASSPPNRHFERPVSSHKKVTEKPKKAL